MLIHIPFYYASVVGGCADPEIEEQNNSGWRRYYYFFIRRFGYVPALWP